MGSLSNYAENKWLDHVLKTLAFTQPTNLYLALSTADPLDTGAGIAEPVGNGYARVNHNTWNAAAGRAITNSGAITFAQASGSWGTISHWAIFDASTAGNMIAHGSFTVAKAIASGDTARVLTGELSVSVNTAGMSNFLANAMLDHTFKNTAYTQATNLYTALATASIADTTTGSTITEPSGNNYSRTINNTWDAAAGASQNTGAITFPQASGSWGTVSHTAIIDASTAGNILLYGTLGTAKAIGTGDTAEFAAGAWDVTID